MASFRLSAVSRRLISSPFIQLRTMTVGEKGSGAGRVGTLLNSVCFMRLICLFTMIFFDRMHNRSEVTSTFVK